MRSLVVAAFQRVVWEDHQSLTLEQGFKLDGVADPSWWNSTTRQKQSIWDPPVMSKYHKMDQKKYTNIFECHIFYRTNIQIYSDVTYYRTIIWKYSYFGNGANTKQNNIQGPCYKNIWIFVLITDWRKFGIYLKPTSVQMGIWIGCE